jgi:hypothetical protein
MATLKGIIQFTGSLDGLSFYQNRKGKIIVRRTGGFKDKPIKTDPRYERTRETASEFGHCARSGKVFRLALRLFLLPMRIPYVHNRVLKLFKDVIIFDKVSARGSRQMAHGLQAHEGRQLLAGFEFDPERTVGNLFSVPYATSIADGQLALPEFDSGEVLFPEIATHATLTFILVRIDFEALKVQPVETASLSFEKGSSVPGTMLAASLPGGDGVLIGLLHIGFSQKANGEVYGLQGSGMRILGVGLWV